MSVWFCAPSARCPGEVAERLERWRAQGYLTALYRDAGKHGGWPLQKAADLILMATTSAYPGYAIVANLLIGMIFRHDPKCDWVVMAADDIDPDPTLKAETIAAECSIHFRLHNIFEDGNHHGRATFGVMQPTGDRWGDRHGAYIDRVAGSPWIGREFARRAYRGKGPYWPEYTHMGVDEELQAVATRLGVFWQRPDLRHHHDHWGRARGNEKLAPRSRMPAFLQQANSQEEWDRYKAIYARRRAAGFPGSELLA